MSDGSAAAESRFVYVTYIKTTAERLWAALIDPEFTQQYWLGARPEAEWKVGGAWKIVYPNGRVMDTGEIVAFEPGKKLAIKWRNEWMPELKAEGYSLCTMEIEKAAGDAMKLTVIHSIACAESKLIGAVSGGWPQILSNLKTLLETGQTALPPKEFK